MIEYSIDEQQRLIHARMSGSNSCADLERHMATVYQDPRYNPTLRTLFQIDKDAGGPLMSELPEVKRLIEMAAQAPNSLKKWAIVIPSDFKRMLVEYFLKDLKLKSLEMRLFANEPAARAWLNDQ